MCSLLAGVLPGIGQGLPGSSPAPSDPPVIPSPAFSVGSGPGDPPGDVTIRTPEGPYFLFLSRPLSFSHPLSHLLPFLTTSRALLTICSIFPALMRDLPFLVARIPGLYLVRVPALVIVA